MTTHDGVRDRVIMVTGGTGSFGHAVTRRFLKEGAREVRIFSRDEKKQDDMRVLFADPRLRFFLGDVREYRSVFDAMQGVQLVFHAAALKQVPSCEFHPMEAVRTNVLGAENVIAAAVASGVGCLVALSTDKSVYPINAMGLSKAMMEKIVIAKSRAAGSTILCTTRYGNVMGSRGSVIPLFMRQIREGRALTVTDPRMTRFLMSLEESVDLVLHAYAHARPGDLFVRKASSCTVGTLAHAVQDVLGTSLPVEVIGTRHGEKLHETLVSREEMVRAEDMGLFYRIPADARDLNYEKFFSDGEQSISQADDYSSHNTGLLEVREVAQMLRGLDFMQDRLHWHRGAAD